LILATMNDLPGHRVVKVLGIVKGNTIRSRHLGHHLLARLRGTVGGEIPEYTKLLAEAREQALDRMREEAHRLGGNAILGVRFSTSEVMRGAAEVIAYGTAVLAEAIA
jgi:uncharacterized protein YbjQ (UPF0145 family)